MEVKSNLPQVSQSEYADILRASLLADQSVIVFGKPGCGKTEIGRQVAAAMDGWGFHATNVLGSDVSDRKGMPNNTGALIAGLAACLENAAERRALADEIRTILSGEATTICYWQRPGELPTAPGPAVEWVDEIGQAPPAMQAMLMPLFLERRSGEHYLPDGYVPCGASNMAHHRAGSSKVLTALMDRATVLELAFNIKDWLDYTKTLDWFPPVIRAYGEWKADEIEAFDPALEVSPTPRSWFRVARLLPLIPKHLRQKAFGGSITEGIALTFCAFLDDREALPPLDDILRTADTCTMFTEPSRLWSLIAALGERAKIETDLQVLNRMGVLCHRMGAAFGVRAQDAIWTEQRGLLLQAYTQDQAGRKPAALPAWKKFFDEYGDLYPSRQQ